MTQRRGFTLFEIALSLALVAVGVVSVLVMLPQGLRAQQQARFQIFAAAKALEMVGAFSTFSDSNNAPDQTRTTKPWDVALTYRSRTPDYESKVVANRFGVQPVPLGIARRLDSDQDEIARLLDQGAYLYYARPRANLGMKEEAQELIPQPPSELRRLVFAVVGDAQQNALVKPHFAQWPAYASYPSPPGYLMTRERSLLWEDAMAADLEVRVIFPYLPDRNPPLTDADYAATTTLGRKAGWLMVSGEDSYWNDPSLNPPVPRGRQEALDYATLAMWYARRRFAEAADASLSDAFVAPTALPTEAQIAAAAADRNAAGLVRAMRILSHATTVLTAHLDSATTAALPLIEVVAYPGAVPGMDVTPQTILLHHEAMMALVMRYSASDPCDWGAKRPVNRAIMMDVPLLQYDLFSPPMTGTIANANDVPAAQRQAEQWTVVAPNRLVGIPGTWQLHDGSRENPPVRFPDTTQFGNPQHFTLTAPFAPQERCRELVFWDVDWQGYNDVETAPSAPVDASEYPFAPPNEYGDNGLGTHRMSYGTFNDLTAPAYRNPEKPLVFLKSMLGEPTGLDVGRLIALGDDMTTEAGLMNNFNNALEDMGNGPKTVIRDGRNIASDTRYVFNGLWGADRNANGRLDRGEVPAAARMRARTVARFVIYDPRVQVTLR